MAIVFDEVTLGIPLSNGSSGGGVGTGVYEFIGEGETFIYVKDSDENIITCNLAYPLMVYISGTLRSTYTYTASNDGLGTKVVLTQTGENDYVDNIQRVFPVNAECSIYYHT
jgi:hypothetical protein